MAKKKSFQISNALSDGLEETITAAHNYSGELRVDIIPIKRIETDPDNPRSLLITLTDVTSGVHASDAHYEQKMMEIAALETLAHSIREQGVINPVLVYKQGEKYRLIAGERRTLASILAGKSDIQARILDEKPNALNISILQWIENIERSDLSLFEKLRNLEKILVAYAEKKSISPEKITVMELSGLIGCAKSQAASYKAVLYADDILQTRIAENKIRSLEKAAFIAGIVADDIRQLAIHACVEGASLKQLRMLVEQNQSRKKTLTKTTTVGHRGRHYSSISFGVTKNLDVARAILTAILSHKELTYLGDYLVNIDFNDYKSMNEAFNLLVKRLEEAHE